MLKLAENSNRGLGISIINPERDRAEIPSYFLLKKFDSNEIQAIILTMQSSSTCHNDITC